MSFPLPITPDNVGIMLATGIITNPAPPAPPGFVPEWYMSDNDLDFENSRFRWNGVNYASLAALTSAGIYADVAGIKTVTMPTALVLADGIGVSTDVTMPATAVGATEQYVWSMDDGVDGVPADELVRLGWATTNNFLLSVTAASTTQAALSTPNGSVLSSVRYGHATSVKVNDVRSAFNGYSLQTPDVSAVMPTLSRIVLKDRGDGLRPFVGTLNRFTMFLGAVPDMGAGILGYSAPMGQYTNAAWSWWNSLIFEHDRSDGFTYATAYLDVAMDNLVYRINPVTKRVSQAFKVGEDLVPKDDHSGGALRKSLSGTRVAIVAGHGDDNLIRVRRSSTALTGFGALSTLVDAGAVTSYPQIHPYGAGGFIVFQYGGDPEKWTVAQSTDDFQTATRKKAMFGMNPAGMTSQQIYGQFGDKSADVARYFIIPHPTNVQNSIRLLEWDRSTGAIYGPTLLGNINDGSIDTPVTLHTALPILRTPAANRSQRLLDVSADATMILGVDYVAADASDAYMFLMVLTGSDAWSAASWTEKSLGAAGVPFWLTSRYFAGACFNNAPHSGISIFAVFEASGTYTLKKLEGESIGSTFAETVIRTTSGGTKLMRPVSPRNASADLPVIWQEGTYTTYLDYAINTRW